MLLFHSYRTLFSDDDLRLFAALGGEAGVLAERQAVLDAQRRLATEQAITEDNLPGIPPRPSLASAQPHADRPGPGPRPAG